MTLTVKRENSAVFSKALEVAKQLAKEKGSATQISQVIDEEKFGTLEVFVGTAPTRIIHTIEVSQEDKNILGDKVWVGSND